MIAIVARKRADGTFPTVGMNDQYLTSRYKSVQSLLRYGIAQDFGKELRIEIYADGHLYSSGPQRTLYINR